MPERPQLWQAQLSLPAPMQVNTFGYQKESFEWTKKELDKPCHAMSLSASAKSGQNPYPSYLPILQSYQEPLGRGVEG